MLEEKAAEKVGGEDAEAQREDPRRHATHGVRVGGVVPLASLFVLCWEEEEEEEEEEEAPEDPWTTSSSGP